MFVSLVEKLLDTTKEQIKMAVIVNRENERLLEDVPSTSYGSACSTAARRIDSCVTARAADNDEGKDENCCNRFCQVLKLRAHRDAMTGSRIHWFIYIAILMLVFFLLLFVTRDEKSDLINVGLIMFMLAGTSGQLWSLIKKKISSIVLFTPQRSHHSNRYLMAGVYVFGTGTLFTVTLRLLIYIHAGECLNSCPPRNVSRACISHVTGMMDIKKANSSVPPLEIIGEFCYSDVVYDVARLIFIMIQMLFLQSFRVAVFNNSSGWVKFVLYHTILTNLCIWVKYVLHETQLFSPKSSHHVKLDTIVATALRLEEVMTPFILEYCLLAGGILHSISKQMIQFPKATTSEDLANAVSGAADDDEQALDGTPNVDGKSFNDEQAFDGTPNVNGRSSNDEQALDGIPIVDGRSSNDEQALSGASNVDGRSSNDEQAFDGTPNVDGRSSNAEQAFDGTPNVDGRSSNAEHTRVSGSQPGLILGISCGLILIAASLTFDNSHAINRRSQDLFLAYEAVLGLLQLIVILIISQTLHHHSIIHGHEEKTDDYLLIFAFLGVVAFDFLAGCSAAQSLNDNENIIILIQVIILFVSRLLQMEVIICSKRYVPKSSNQRFRRSAARIRQCALFLLTTNLSFWALDSFIELKDMAQTSYPAGKYIFGDKWITIVALTYPLAIFFRFHAAAMLFELWARFNFHQKEG